MFDRLLIPSITPCPVGALLQELEPAASENLKSALAMGKELSNARIARAIKEEADRRISPETVSAHRKGECRCSMV